MDVAHQKAPRILSAHDPRHRAPAAEIDRLRTALAQYPQVGQDQTAATRLLESRVADLLGQDEALFLPSGKLAQQIALRIHADQRPGRTTVVAHPSNHLSLVEDSNLGVLHGLHIRGVGDRYRLWRTPDVADAVAAYDVAAALWELPQREIGGELPAWEDLCEQLAAASAAGVATHADGARLWQTGPFYGRSPAEVARRFDSVYVSLYKDLGAPRGAVLCGSGDLVAAARLWNQRLGGTIDEAWPLALLALDGLDRGLSSMPARVEHARALAEAVTAVAGVSVRPAVPQAAMFHVHLPVAAEAARAAQDSILARGGLGLALRFRTTADPTRCCFEVTIGESALGITPDEVVATLQEVLRLAGAS